MDVLAHLATRGTATLAVVEDAAGDGRLDPSRIAAADLHPRWLPALARTCALHLRVAHDTTALALVRAVAGLPDSWPHVTLDQASTFAQLLFQQGVTADEVERAMQRWPGRPDIVATIEADARHPLADPRGLRLPASSDAWLGRVARVLGWDDHLSLEPGADPALDRLRIVPPARRQVTTGPLVSVVVPVFRPTLALVSSVRSLVAQTWRDPEVIVVDDGSGPQADALLAAVDALDPRVRIVRLPDNRGTYTARNAGVARARGELVAFQDADDRSHPERIAAQAQAPLDRPFRIATTSRAGLVADDLGLVRLGYRPIAHNTSSLMFRADLVTSTIGGFDPVHRGADTEYELRIRARFGDAAVATVPRVLALVRKQATSLSGADFGPRWQHRARQRYRHAYEDWHAATAGTSQLFLDPSSPRRPFPAPRRACERDRTTVHPYDVLVVGDWESLGGPQRSMLEEIAALRRAGHTVAVAHLEPLRFMSTRRRALCPPVRELIRTGEVDLVQWDDPTAAELLLLRYPPLLQFPPDAPPAWDVARVWIVVNQPPTERDGTDLRYLPPDCDANARRLFGQAPTWVPQGPTARTSLAPWADRLTIADHDDVGIIDRDAWWSDHTPTPDRTPRIGRYSRDHPLKFPADADTLLAAYGDPDFEVRMMGAARSVPAILADRDVPATWHLLAQDAVDVRTFLDEVDYFVHFDHPERNEAFGRSILEAAASGCLVVLPPTYRPVFGDAAVYCEPHEVPEVVRHHHALPSAFRAATSRAARVVDERFSHRAFLDLVDLDRATERAGSTGRSAPDRSGHLVAVRSPRSRG